MPNPSPKPLPQRLAAPRRRHTDQRITARVAGLGFADVGGYLTDWVVQRALLLAEGAGELAAHRLTCAGCWTATGSCFEREQITVRG